MNPFFRVSGRNSYRWRLAWRVAALLLACNYFAFRVELFDDEVEKNQPACDPYSHHASFSFPTLNWETFDKDNAPKALTVQADTHIVFLSVVACPIIISQLSSEPYQPVRDKSPPLV